jgi:hypothetical protein
MEDPALRKIFDLFVELAIEFLDGGNTAIQNIFYDYFTKSPSSE